MTDTFYVTPQIYSFRDVTNKFISFGNISFTGFAGFSPEKVTLTDGLRSLDLSGVAVGGNITLNLSAAAPSAVPEAATWAMMFLGIGTIGFAMRHRRKVSTQVSYAV